MHIKKIYDGGNCLILDSYIFQEKWKYGNQMTKWIRLNYQVKQKYSAERKKKLNKIDKNKKYYKTKKDEECK